MNAPFPDRYRSGTIAIVKKDIHVRIDEEITDAVRAYAGSHGISLAAAVSLLLRRALRGEGQS